MPIFIDAASDSPVGDAACNLGASAKINGTFLGSTLNAREPLSFQGAQGAAYAASVFVPIMRFYFRPTFSSGDHVTGAVAAPACTAAPDGGALTCL